MKGITDVPAGAVRVRSAKSAGLRSAPKTKAGSYLDLFALSIERLKLREEQAILEKRRFQTDARMEQNSRRLEELRAAMLRVAQGVIGEEGDAAPRPRNRRGSPPRKWRTVAVDY